MKTLVMIICMAIATISFSFAQEGQGQMNRIDQIELPLSIQEDLTIGEFSDWDVVESFELPAEAREENEAYRIIVQREDQVMSLFYDEDGNLIRQERQEE